MDKIDTAQTPTVGRKVWYYRRHTQLQPIDATVIKVLGIGPRAHVNLDAVDPDDGRHFVVTGVCVGDQNADRPHYRWPTHAKLPRVDITSLDYASTLPVAAMEQHARRVGEQNYEPADHADIA